MPNFDGVWELRIFYTSTLSTAPVLDHVLRLDVNVTGEGAVGDPIENFDATRRNSATANMDVIIDELMDLIKPCFSADTEFGRAELWKIPEATYNATFYSVYELGFAGTNAGANNLSQQTTFTFRSAGGGTGRVQLMESAFSGSLRQSPPFAAAVANSLSNYIIGSTSAFLARDNTPFIARIHQCDGQNEIIWRKRNRL